MKFSKSTTKNVTLKLCVTAMFAALIVGGKMALAAIPNVEVVTLFVALCAYVWGLTVAIPAVCVFIAVDTAIWGVNTWVISYLIHWNTVALCFWLLSRLRLKRKVLEVVFATASAAVLTTCFGVLTSVVDTVIGFAGNGFFVDFANFGKRFAAMYVAGGAFYVTQIVTNLVLFSTAFLPLVIVNRRAKLRMFGDSLGTEPTEPCNSRQE